MGSVFRSFKICIFSLNILFTTFLCTPKKFVYLIKQVYIKVFSEKVCTVLETSKCLLFGYVQEIQNFKKIIFTILVCLFAVKI